MDNKFHINSNGDVKPCKARMNACQFGDSSLHFSDPVEARKTVEYLISKAKGSYKVLAGKKKTLKDLEAKAIKESDPFKKLYEKPYKAYNKAVAEAGELPFAVRENNYITKLASESFLREVPINKTPKEIQQLFKKALDENEELRALLKDNAGNYAGVSYSRAKNKFSTWRAPKTKDIPLTMKVVGGWDTSLHPKGPKVEFQCSSCGSLGQERLGDFPHKKQGDFRIRCSHCNQMGTVALEYS